MRLFSYKNRAVHKGPYPLERLERQSALPDLSQLSPFQGLDFNNTKAGSLIDPMADFMAMLDAIREGATAAKPSDIPSDPSERSRHLKATGYYFDATMVGVGPIPQSAHLPEPIRNQRMDKLATNFEKAQPKTFASGIDVLLADVRDCLQKRLTSINHHRFAIVLLVEHPRKPGIDETGSEWIQGSCTQRSALRAGESAVVIANYLRLMGFEARAHTLSSSDLDLPQLSVCAGLTRISGNLVSNPFVGKRFSLAAVSTDMNLEIDQPLAADEQPALSTISRLKYQLGLGGTKRAGANEPFQRRQFVDGLHPHEKLKRRKDTTTYIDEPRVARVPKRADLFARALFGDMGEKVQANTKNGKYIAKNPLGACARRALGAIVLLQDGPTANAIASSTLDPKKNSDNIKASLYYLGCDAVGISRCPDWAYYSHDAEGKTITPYHSNAITLLVDQGHETMEGSSGDDWVSGAQSMRAYLRTSLLGGIVAQHIRSLGYSARVHSALDGEVLQPPLLLLSGLGEVSRIGEVILNPFLGPRLKSGVITTNMPLAHDQPIDFGLQTFCSNCNKCARECPSGAITAGPKLMFNGYEIWKSDSEKCARYRLTNEAGSMCGRCMKTCPWNLEGLFAEAPFRWAAMKIPKLAKAFAALDDFFERGSINPIKKWWWNIEATDFGNFIPAKKTQQRELQKDLVVNYADQTLACYPAPLVPPPYPVPFPMDREAGIKAYKSLLCANQHKAREAQGDTDNLVPKCQPQVGPAPVMQVELTDVKKDNGQVSQFVFRALDGSALPNWEAGSHIDVTVAPEFFRQYSLTGDPANNQYYTLGVLREDQGRGGSLLLHRVFRPGRKVFISEPRNHFPLREEAKHSVLIAGGIGVTPLIAMAYRLHQINRPFQLHYCARGRETAGFIEELTSAPWAEHVTYHFSASGQRADLTEIIPGWQDDWHLYTCGPNQLMDSVFTAATDFGWPTDSLHREYFAAPANTDYKNHRFYVRIQSTDQRIAVSENQSAAEALRENGVAVELKCSDGLCGICKTPFSAGDVEHRDYVLSKEEQQTELILCCSRAQKADDEIVIDL